MEKLGRSPYELAPGYQAPTTPDGAGGTGIPDGVGMTAVIPILAPGSPVALTSGAPIAGHNVQPAIIPKGATASAFGHFAPSGGLHIAYSTSPGGPFATTGASVSGSGASLGDAVALPADCAGLVFLHAVGDASGTVGNVSLVLGGVAVAPASDCAVTDTAFWAEDFADVADTAAYDAATGSAPVGSVRYAFAPGPFGVYAIDAGTTFCGHPTLTVTYGGAAAGAEWADYFGPFVGGDGQEPSYADAWARLRVEIPTAFLSAGLRLLELGSNDDAGTFGGLYLSGGRAVLISYGSADDTTETLDLAASSAVVTGAMMDVVVRYASGGGGFTVTAYAGAQGGPLALLGTVTRTTTAAVKAFWGAALQTTTAGVSGTIRVGSLEVNSGADPFDLLP